MVIVILFVALQSGRNEEYIYFWFWSSHKMIRKKLSVLNIGKCFFIYPGKGKENETFSSNS